MSGQGLTDYACGGVCMLRPQAEEDEFPQSSKVSTEDSLFWNLFQPLFFCFERISV